MDADAIAGEARLHRAVRALAAQTGAPVDQMIDWLCNGGLANMMLVYATAKPPVVVGPAAEQIPEPPRPKLTPLSAHPALAAANEWAELTAAWDQLPFGTRAYYDALAKCDAAWERIAAACGVSTADGGIAPANRDAERDNMAGGVQQLPVAKPTGFVATCRCGRNVGALDLERTPRQDASRLLGEWLMRGCTVAPRFTGTWSAQIEPCACASACGAPTSEPDWHPCRDVDGATCADSGECASGCVRLRTAGARGSEHG